MRQSSEMASLEALLLRNKIYKTEPSSFRELYIPSPYFGSFRIQLTLPKRPSCKDIIDGILQFTEAMDADEAAIETWRHNNPKKYRLAIAIRETEAIRALLWKTLKETELL